jgi:hypothetical protein
LRRQLNLAKENEICTGEQSAEQIDKNSVGEFPCGGKRLFVEPEISVPVDVLEATTFFQTVASAPTN